MTTTDTIQQAIAKHLDELRPVMDHEQRPNGLRIAVWLLPDGTIREIELSPVFKMTEGKR